MTNGNYGNVGQLGIPQIDQYTVDITSSTVAKKIAGFAGPFQVINLNIQATVWLGDNPQIKAGSGIPLNPGSSLTWTGSQNTKELYAILGTDSQSVGETASLVIGASVQGWQQNPTAFAIAALNAGVILVDSPIAVIPLTPLTPGVTVLPAVGSLYDVSTLQSVYVNYQIGGAAHTVQLVLQWYAGPNGTANESAGFDIFNWTAADRLNLIGKCLPVRGSYLQITTTIAGAGATDSLTIMGSHRQWNHLSAHISDRVLVTANAAALAAGASLTGTPIVRYDGPATIAVVAVQGAAPDGLEVGVYDLVNGVPICYAMPLSVTETGAFLRTAYTANFVIPRSSWNVAVRNSSAGPHIVQFEVIAAPEGT